MKTLLLCAFVITLLGVTALTSSSDATNRLDSIPFGVTNLFSAEAQATLKPQVYKATPYTCFVIVPKPVDTAAIISPPSTNQFTIRTIQPQMPLRLESVK
jgi:hypothetical protein